MPESTTQDNQTSTLKSLFSTILENCIKLSPVTSIFFTLIVSVVLAICATKEGASLADLAYNIMYPGLLMGFATLYIIEIYKSFKKNKLMESKETDVIESIRNEAEAKIENIESQALKLIDDIEEKYTEIEGTYNRTFEALQLGIGFSNLHRSAEKLSTEHFSFYNETTRKIAAPRGAVVVKAQAEDYFNYLEELLSISNKSFLATLRGGGKDKPAYTLNWFTDDIKGVSLSPERRLDYLRAIRESDIPKKIRLLLFSKEEIQTFLLDRKKREDVLGAMLAREKTYGKAGDVYQVNPELLIERYLNTKFTEPGCQIAYDDFAIFDDKILLKHDGQVSLTMSIQDQMEFYHEIFKSLEQHRNIFTRLTLDNYGTQKWEDWEKETRDKIAKDTIKKKQ